MQFFAPWTKSVVLIINGNMYWFCQLTYSGKGGPVIARLENKSDVLSSFDSSLLRLGDLDFFFEAEGAFAFGGIFSALLYPLSLSSSSS